jgi:hypothetical protein
MSATASSINLNTSGVAAIAEGNSADFKEVPMRETVALVRDVFVVVTLQVVFRTMMFLRKLNY